MSSSLQDISIRLANDVLKLASQSSNQASPIKACLSISGGGSTAISTITSIPGSSNFLLDGSVLYDRRSIAQYLSSSSCSEFQQELKQISQQIQKAKGSSSQDRAKFSFVSTKSASLLSNSALHQAMALSSSLQQSMNVLGIGCTSTVVSSPSTSNSRKRISRAHIVISHPIWNDTEFRYETPSVRNIAYTIALSDDGSRNRVDEEQTIGCLILWCVKSSLASIVAGDDSINTEVEDETSYKEILNLDGDSMTKMVLPPPNDYNDIDSSPLEDTPNGSNSNKSTNKLLQTSVRHVLDGRYKTMVVVPRISTEGANQQEGTNKMIPLAHCVIPPNPLIFPGSFNPPHIGHVTLANAAKKTMIRKRLTELREWFQEEVTDSHNVIEDMWNTIEHQEYKSVLGDEGTSSHLTSCEQNIVKCPVLFEMSLTNADKPSMEANEAQRRIELFLEYPSTVTQYSDLDSSTSLPNDWGVLLTSSALFIDKARLLRKYLAPSYPTLASTNEPTRQMTFVIGTDTMVRILNPKYYDDSNDKMLNAMREMKMEGVHFVVGGRLEQVKDENNSVVTKFVSGKEALCDLPDDVRDMFTIIEEEDFRVDISSTEIRAAVKKASTSTEKA